MRLLATLAALLLALAPAAAAQDKDASAEDAPGTAAPAKDGPAKNAPGKDAPGRETSTGPAPPADVPAAPQPWVRQVYAIVVRSMTPLSRSLPRGDYRVHFSIDEEGRGSRYGVEGAVGAAQAAVITGSLAAHAFPAPPDGASHAMSFTVRMK